MEHPLFALLSLAVFCGGFVPVARAQEDASPDPYANETQEQRDARMGWWRDARFGMFIHWGVYAVPAGKYREEKIGGIGEWIMRRATIPVDEYRAFAREFNPVKFDADEWVRLAKEAGMKYIVITSKHHDGFALFDSKVTDWDVVDATPYGKDLLRPLEQACKRHGLKLGFYYSQAQDWIHPGGAKSGLYEGEGWDEAHKGSFDQYLKDIATPQVEEILGSYDIDVLWWDTPIWMNRERADQLLPLVRLRPAILTNNRLGGGYRGDFSTPEQSIPATGLDYDWETCMTMNRTWGYKSYDHDWKSTETLIRNLVDIVSKGGNYLLNVGPTAEGLIPEPSVQRLKDVGRWMKVNGSSIYGTTASPFSKLTWGRCTKQVNERGGTLYLHVFEWPDDGAILCPGLRNEVVEARLLDAGTELETRTTQDGVVVSVPAEPADQADTVIELRVKGALDVEKVPPRVGTDGALVLSAEMADIHNPGYGDHARVESKYGKPNIGYWMDARTWVEWSFRVDQAGSYSAEAIIAAPVGGVPLVVSVQDQEHRIAVGATGDYGSFNPMRIGRFTFDGPGVFKMAVKPADKESWKPVNLRSVKLQKVD